MLKILHFLISFAQSNMNRLLMLVVFTA